MRCAVLRVVVVCALLLCILSVCVPPADAKNAESGGKASNNRLVPQDFDAVSEDFLDDDDFDVDYDDFDDDAGDKDVAAKTAKKPADSKKQPTKQTTPPSSQISSSPSSLDNDDDDDILFDEDEFVGVPSAEASIAGVKDAKSTPKKTKVPLGPLKSGDKEKDHFYYEYAGLAFIALYIINFFVGKRKNDKVARRWFEAIGPMIAQQFYALNESEDDKSKGQGLIKESPFVFRLYATGRRYCTGLLATLELKRRQDLFSMLLALVDLSTTRDSVTIEIPMSDEHMEPFVFAIVRKRFEKKMRKTLKDLGDFTSPMKSARLPASLVVLTDCPELEAELVDEKLVRALKAAGGEDLFVSLHLSDQNPLGFGGVGAATTATTPQGNTVAVPGAAEYRKLLRFKFNLPASGSAADMEQLKPLVAAALQLIDRVATRTLSAQAKSKAIHLRKQVQENLNRQTAAARQEARARRKEEQKRASDEPVAAGSASGAGAAAAGAGAGAGAGAAATTTETHTRVLTREQQRKKEEKERLQQLKRRQPRLKIMR